jgi:hypothetical protein
MVIVTQARFESGSLYTDHSTDMLKEILDEDVKESPEEYEERLSALTKDQLIAEMMRKKVSFGKAIARYHVFNPDVPPRPPCSVSLILSALFKS